MTDEKSLTLTVGELIGRVGSLERAFQDERLTTAKGFKDVGDSLEEIKGMIQDGKTTDAGRTGFVKGAGWVAAGVMAVVFTLGGSVAIIVKSWLGFPTSP
jgi:hypothetical protein